MSQTVFTGSELFWFVSTILSDYFLKGWPRNKNLCHPINNPRNEYHFHRIWFKLKPSCFNNGHQYIVITSIHISSRFCIICIQIYNRLIHRCLPKSQNLCDTNKDIRMINTLFAYCINSYQCTLFMITHIWLLSICTLQCIYPVLYICVSILLCTITSTLQS